MNPIDKFILKLIGKKISRWFDLERALANRLGSIGARELSPQKTWPDPMKIPLGGEVPFSLRNFFLVGSHLKSSVHQGMRAITSLSENPPNPRLKIEPLALKAFEDQAAGLGIGAIGYVQLPRELIFQERAVLYDKAIVLLKEMDKVMVDRAPSTGTFKMVFETYDVLGKAVNTLTDGLREKGYAAQGCHPLGGLVLYPPLAAAAGLGWMGRHGLLITPQFGPRLRIAAIFTSINNLPLVQDNQHAWIADFCANCGRCIRTCPAEAIREKPFQQPLGRKTHIIRDKCLPVFVNQQGCTVCVKECMFNRRSYSDIRCTFLAKQADCQG